MYGVSFLQGVAHYIHALLYIEKLFREQERKNGRKEELGREERKGKGGRRKERDDFVDVCLTVFK